MQRHDKIYIPGHRGLAGSAIVRRLEKAGFDNLLLRRRDELDLCDQPDVEAFFNAHKPDYVILAAAKVGGIHANRTYPADFIQQNLAIQTHVIHQSYRHGVKRLLFLGSSCIYPKHAPQPMCEEHLMTGPLEPTNEAYAMAKIAGIHMCWAYNRQYATRFVPLMPTNLYGPGDNFDLHNAHVLPAMLRKFHLARLAAQGNLAAIEEDEARFGPIDSGIKRDLGMGPDNTGAAAAVTLWGSGTPRREFLLSDDLADACLTVMQSPWKTLIDAMPDGAPLLFNVGAGRDLAVKSLAERIAAVVGYDGPMRWDASMPDGTPRKLLDVSRLAWLGWRAPTPLSTGLEETYAWYRRQGGL